MKTRSQRIQAEQAGVAPSPPRALTNEPRPKRKKAQVPSTAARASSSASSKHQPATQPSASQQLPTDTRTARTIQRGRGRGRPATNTQGHTQHAAPQVSAASAQAAASAAQSAISTHTQPSAPSNAVAQAGGAGALTVGNVNGMTQTSPSGSATHPVFASHGTSCISINAQPVPGTLRSSQTSQPVSDGRATPASSPATHPVSATHGSHLSTPKAQPVQEKRTPSETSQLFTRILASPVSYGTNPGTLSLAKNYPGYPLASPDSSPNASPSISKTKAAEGPAPAVAPGALHKEPITVIHEQPPAVRHERSPTATPSVLSGTEPITALPRVYNLPKTRFQNYSLVHVFVDSLPQTIGRYAAKDTAPSIGDSIAFAIPTEQLPLLLTVAGVENRNLEEIKQRHPVAKRICEEYALTSDLLTEIRYQPNPAKRKREECEEERLMESQFRTAEAYVRLQAEKKRAAGDEKGASDGRPPPTKRIRTKQIVPQRYDAKGNLTLGKYKEVVMYVDEYGSPVPRWPKTSNHFLDNLQPKEHPYVGEEVTDTNEEPMQGLFTDQPQQEQVPETPRRGWGLSSLLPSAQTVSKFLPFTSRRTASATTTSPTQRVAQTEPRQRNTDIESRNRIFVPNATGGLAKRRHNPKPKKQLLTKAQMRERQELQQEKDNLREARDIIIAEEARVNKEKKEWEEQRARMEAAQTPGAKRKRMPSPDVIPLPPGGGFGLHPDYFGYISDEDFEEDELEQETPTKQPASKKARTSTSTPEIIGDPHRATPYTGYLFAGPDKRPEEPFGFVEEEEGPTENAATPVTVPYTTNTFTVPSPSENDSDEDDIEGETDDNTPSKVSTNAQNSSQASKQSQPDSAAAESTSISMAPPPRPNPSHATLPPPTRGWQFVDPVAKARQKLLKHQPKHGSRLRESSRLSSSTVGSDAGDEVADVADKGAEADKGADADIEPNESEYDPRKPALQPPFTTDEQSNVSQSMISQNNVGQSVQQATPTGLGQAPGTSGDGATAEDEMVWAYDEYAERMTGRVKKHIDRSWDIIADTKAAEAEFDAGLEEYKQQEDEAMTDAMTDAAINANVQVLINTEWTEHDTRMAEEEFDVGFAAFKAEQQRPLLAGVAA